MPFEWLKRGLVFSAYVCWLVSFPMSGPLLSESGAEGLLFFLLPQAAALLAIGRFLAAELFRRISLIAIWLTVFLTILYPLAAGYSTILFGLLGISSSFFVLRMILILKDSPDPILSAAFGLALGNLLVFLLALLPLATAGKMVLIALPLVSAAFHSVAVTAKREIGELKKFLPLIFVFYLLGGLYYGFIIEHYSRAAIYPGMELFFYILTALAGVYAVRRNREIGLALGILAGAASFSLIQAGSPLLINLGMFASQISFALVDLYLLTLIIGLGASLNIAGYGLGIMLLAISGGKLISGVAPPITNILVASGNIILIGAVMLLYFMGRRTPGEAAVSNATAAADAKAPFSAEMVERLNRSSESFQKKFSQKEKQVLELVLQGKPYREVAARIGISESSVKTYMSRIYEKTGTGNKEDLLTKLRELP